MTDRTEELKKHPLLKYSENYTHDKVVEMCNECFETGKMHGLTKGRQEMQDEIHKRMVKIFSTTTDDGVLLKLFLDLTKELGGGK